MATEEGGWDDFWPKDKADRHDWRTILSADERPALGYVPDDFVYPERYDDDLELNKFDPKKPPVHTTSDTNDATSTFYAPKLRTVRNYRHRIRWKGGKREPLVASVAVYGGKEIMSGVGGILFVRYANSVNLSAANGWIIDLLRGTQPGTTWPDDSQPNLIAELIRGYWMIVPIMSPNNVNIIPALLKVLRHNGDPNTDPKDRIPICPTRLAPKGWWFYAFPIQYRNGPTFRVFHPETGREMPETEDKPRHRKNGIIFPSSNDPQFMLHASARWLHTVEKVKKIALADDFNPLQTKMLDELREVSAGWFEKPMKERVSRWNAAVNGKSKKGKTVAVVDSSSPRPVLQQSSDTRTNQDAPRHGNETTLASCAEHIEDAIPVAGPSSSKSKKRRASESSDAGSSAPELPLARPKTKRMRPI
ncbi:hypothetical protein CYLTODRAFT_493262 [Cylindrobasidium torrendii FP15055 ss-10]|uniref:Uncharacterized protein n=1 Tax=Cylindrobasidium torrendii FP15055 ss-10 TaxID=1314674 RepID=A0A0D7B230_9AGAR|nr:hypothetical protein CYLTODRAFT_493262 [Cylindrobasidium torrendii FP15055 ss-10]